MRTWFRSSGLIIGLLALFLVPAISAGQTSKGTIAGTITDPAGGAISGATVTAQSTQLGEKISARS